MHGTNGVPILGGASVADVDKEYLVELCTADGGKHRVTVNFERPGTSANGVVDLGQVKVFDAEEQAIANMSRALVAGVYGNPERHPPMIIVDSGAAVVWRHVVSFRFLGSADELKAAQAHLASGYLPGPEVPGER